jgi:arylsulfatase A-like enzyme
VVDQLAAQGVRFSNAFVTTSICAASRASFLTGLYERSHGYTFRKPPISAEHMSTSYPMLLRKAGYRTGFVGKYGVSTKGRPEQEMFDVFKTHGRNPYHKKQKDGTLRHETEIAGDKAIEFLKSQPADSPFCLSISFNAVHAEDSDKEDPFPWPKAVDGMYDELEIPEPRLGAPSIYENHPEFLKKSMNRKRFFWRWHTPEKYQQNMKAYYRMISGVDHVIGRIRTELERLKLSENTIIVYMGDNGYYMGDRGFAGKWTHYEQSLRVPLIVYDPRLPTEKQGLVREEMALNIDVPATMLALAGVEVPARYQGRSLVPLINGQKVSDWRNEFLCEHLMHHADIPKWEGVRGERYVYARYFDQEPAYEFLHDLKTDPDQLTNLASLPEHRETLKMMREKCTELLLLYRN